MTCKLGIPAHCNRDFREMDVEQADALDISRCASLKS